MQSMYVLLCLPSTQYMVMIDDNPQEVTVPLHPSLKKTSLKDVGTTDILV